MSLRNPPQGARLEFHNLVLHRHSTYEKSIHNGDTIFLVHRYDFRSECKQFKYVYSGVSLGIREGAKVSIKGTVKAPMDRFGYIRLQRVKLLPVDLERLL